MGWPADKLVQGGVVGHKTDTSPIRLGDEEGWAAPAGRHVDTSNDSLMKQLGDCGLSLSLKAKRHLPRSRAVSGGCIEKQDNLHGPTNAHRRFVEKVTENSRRELGDKAGTHRLCLAVTGCTDGCISNVSLVRMQPVSYTHLTLPTICSV